MSRFLERRPKRPPLPVREWLRYLRYSAKADHIKAPDAEIHRLAGLLAIVGSPVENPVVLTAFRVLFFKSERVNRWHTAIATIPPEEESILHITACVMVYQEHADPRNVMEKVKLNLTNVIEMMLEVPDPQAHVRHAMEDGMRHPNGVFHPTTIEASKAKLRGVLGDLADDDYSRQRSSVTEVEG